MQEHGVSEQHILKQRDMQTIYTHQVFRKLGNTREAAEWNKTNKTGRSKTRQYTDVDQAYELNLRAEAENWGWNCSGGRQQVEPEGPSLPAPEWYSSIIVGHLEDCLRSPVSFIDACCLPFKLGYLPEHYLNQISDSCSNVEICFLLCHERLVTHLLLGSDVLAFPCKTVTCGLKLWRHCWTYLSLDFTETLYQALLEDSLK